MSKTLVKWYFLAPWREVEHEQWLQEQSRLGLHLVSVNSLGLHRFRRAEPLDTVFRWTIIPDGERAHYEQLYQDAGWERAGWIWGYHCWRKPAAAGQTEIFTEPGSKIRQHWHQIKWVLPFSLLFMERLHSHLAQGNGIGIAFYSAVLAIDAYTVFRLGERILALKRTVRELGSAQ